MRNPGTAAAVSVLLGLSLNLALLVPFIAAQEVTPGAPPPALGTVVLEDPLTARGVVVPYVCRTGRSRVELVGEGTIMKVTGPCSEGQEFATAGQSISALTVPDGEIRLEVKAVSGQDRALFGLSVRRPSPVPSQAGGDDGYYIGFRFAEGRAAIIKLVNRQRTDLATRTDLGALLAPSDWNSIAVRMQGPNLWVLLNDQPIMAVSDPSFDTGSVVYYTQRLGDLNDTQESAAVVRNLRISGLANGELARAPTYGWPTNGPPWIGDIRFGYDESGRDAIPSGGTLRAVPGGTVYHFVRWRDIPAGAVITVEARTDGRAVGAFDFQPEAPDGERRWVRYTFNFNLATWSGTTAEVVFSLNGQELARGSVELRP